MISFPAVSHVMPLQAQGAMNPSAVMPPPPPQAQSTQSAQSSLQVSLSGGGGGGASDGASHLGQTSPTESNQQSQGGGGSGGGGGGGSGSSGGSGQGSYYGQASASQMPNTEGKFGSALNNVGASSVSPHMQQNGYVTMASQQPNSVQALTYTQPPPQGVGGVVAAAAQGTWTGSSTLTYTQSMQPPDPRSHHGGYCE